MLKLLNEVWASMPIEEFHPNLLWRCGSPKIWLCVLTSPWLCVLTSCAYAICIGFGTDDNNKKCTFESTKFSMATLACIIMVDMYQKYTHTPPIPGTVAGYHCST
jgi:hypothetical protein